jgi:hypothetical protein
MITFAALDDTEQTAEVWSPGPLPRTVWALLTDGRPVVVHVDRLTEVHAPGDPRDWRARPCSIVGPYYVNHNSPSCSCADRARSNYLAECRNVPDTFKTGELLSLF